MKKIFSKKLLLLFSAIAFISYGFLWACAGGDWDEYGNSAFTPEAFVDNSYKPFFFSQQFYYDIGFDEAHRSRFNDAIVKDWTQYLGKNNQAREVQFLLLNASKQLIDSIQAMPLKTLPKNIAAMQLVLNKAEPKIAQMLRFLSYAKANEAYAAAEIEYWRYDEQKPIKKLSSSQLAMVKQMEKEFDASNDLFLKQRYFFQIVRAIYFAQQYQTCIAFYKKHQQIFPENILAARCESYVAGAFYKMKNYAEANYRYSKVFEVAPEFKTVAYFSFHPQDETDWQQTLALCKSKEEQITLWQILGIYFDEQRAIKEIYALNPKAEKLELLLARLINIQEQKVLQHSYNQRTYRFEGDKFDAKELDIRARSLVAGIAKAENTSKPYMWHIANGYLCFLNSDYLSANSYYNMAQKNLKSAPELAKAQHRLFVFMNRVASAEKIDAQTEKLLLPDLQWLEHDAHSLPNFRYDYAYSWAKKTIGKKYKAQGDTVRSEMFYHQDSFFANPVQVQLLKDYLKVSPTAQSFDYYCHRINTISVNGISEYQAIALAYQNKISEAITLMATADSVKDAKLFGNPFNGNIKDCHDCDHAATQKVKYSKLSFLQKLQELKSNVDNRVDVYNNALLLGNAFYNMSHFGNARMFYEGAVIGCCHSAPDILPDFIKPTLLNMSNASAYYKTALSVATNEEQKAKLNYLLLKIERNEHYKKIFANPDYSGWDYAAPPATNFSLLAAYKHTKYYKEVIAECGYFRAYLGVR
ncbi:MAG: hypothetical protein IT256_08285 [Chitinophagaceae bacterium]|nr:hypothetical protein [Chitinophagaceae bacterium]